MRFFSRTPAPFLDADDEAWIIGVFAWLDRWVEPAGWLLSRPMVLPTPALFPATELAGHERAAFVFDYVRRHMGMADWDCTLVAQPPRPGLGLAGIPFHGAMQVQGAAGTFSTEGNAAVISYDPAEIGRPMRLIAILTHELAHYRLAAIAEAPPGGAALAEQATDLTALAFGFGVFGANAAFEFGQHQDFQSSGWKTQRLGYLTERVWIFGLAALLLATGREAGPIESFLKPHLRSDLRAAVQSLRKRPGVLAPLRRGALGGVG
jgi:hypothetical protein